MRRIFAQVRKELTQIMRDRLALALALLLPLILLVVLGSAISLTVTDSADRGAGSGQHARFAELPLTHFAPRSRFT